MTPYTISVSDEMLDDLQERLARVRFPDQLSDVDWDYGADLAYMQELVEYWRDVYDWRIHETELNRLEKSDYFQFFAGTHESTDASIKKAFFGAAKRYHPDALLDDSDVYRSLAEVLFSEFSEAWETLSDPELRDRYTRKHIFGEKDENDIAMEQVQRVLDAEASFKNGLRLLNAGKVHDALRHFKRAHDDYAEEGEYLAYYAFTLFRATRPSDPARADEALGMMKEAVALAPNALKPYHLLGKAHLLKGDGKEAKRYLRKVLKTKPDDADALRDYRRADALEGGGESSGKGRAANSKKMGGFFSRFGRKKRVSPMRKSEEELFLDNLDLDREL
jgi:curved DNA-binding protein CbpA